MLTASPNSRTVGAVCEVAKGGAMQSSDESKYVVRSEVTLPAPSSLTLQVSIRMELELVVVLWAVELTHDGRVPCPVGVRLARS